jgi:hypothetical protein
LKKRSILLSSLSLRQSLRFLSFIQLPRLSNCPISFESVQKRTLFDYILHGFVLEGKPRLAYHFRNIKDPENALVTRQLWFDNLPAVMRVRITTPNVLKALRKRSPEVAKPYNFALSPILIQPSSDCTLVAPASKHPEDWLAREYTEIHSGDIVKLGSEYHGKTLTPQTLSSVIWRHFLHPEDKSLSPDGGFSNSYTRGLLLRRPIKAITPFIPIGKEIERRSQEGEDISIFDNAGPVKYHPRKTANTRPADAALTQRASGFPKKLLRRKSGVSQHAIDRFLDSERIHPGTRKNCQKQWTD